MLLPDCCPTGGAGAEHPEGEEDGGDVGQAQRDHQGPVLNIQGKVWKPQQAHQGSLLRTPDIYVIYSDDNFQSDFKGKLQKRQPSSERSSRLNIRSDLKGLDHILPVKNLIRYPRKIAKTFAKHRKIIKAQY